MLKTVVTYLLSQMPDTVKIVIATAFIAIGAIIYSRIFTIEEISAYVNPIQKYNEQRFQTLLQHNDRSFNLLRDDILEVKRQNNKIIQLHLKRK